MAKTKVKRAIRKKPLINVFGFTPVYLMALILLGAVALVLIISKIDTPYQQSNDIIDKVTNKTNNQIVKSTSFKQFKSAEEFKQYIEDMDGQSFYGAVRSLAVEESFTNTDVALGAPVDDWGISDSNKAIGIGGGSPDRVSGTNVQVLGIDEPDIVKTNGQEIYFSDNMGVYYPVFEMRADVEEKIVPPQYQVKTNIVNAWPPSDLELASEIDLSGELLLAGDTLLVFSGQKIVAYDVSDPKSPTQKWDIKLENDTYLVTSRLYNDRVYLVTQTTINRYNPCPITPLLRNGSGLIIPCTDIYYPNGNIYSDSTFTVLNIDPQSGNIDSEISIVGSQYSSNIYMSQNALYIAYTKNLEIFDFMYGMITTEMTDLLPSDVLTRIKKLKTYDISSNSKFNELETIFYEWQKSLNDDDELRMQNEMSNRAERYYEKHKRSLVTTGLVKIDVENLQIKASGDVPGYLLNQFSMDEYKDHLRVATTIGDAWGFGGGRDSQANDVYVLNSDLNITGSVLDLGISERIYSVRFIGDLGYLVTFRQTDPFYILDLSNPNSPKMTGELKIPGYSSYLHPISQDRILGIGMENGRVKLSYFNVSDSNNPQEIDKYSLDEYGSETFYNHHAFLQDVDNQVFFLPSYQGGYIFSYANDNLELVRALSVPNVKRALYLDNYMYILADDYIAVLNEVDWEKVNEIDL